MTDNKEGKRKRKEFKVVIESSDREPEGMIKRKYQVRKRLL